MKNTKLAKIKIIKEIVETHIIEIYEDNEITKNNINSYLNDTNNKLKTKHIIDSKIIDETIFFKNYIEDMESIGLEQNTIIKKLDKSDNNIDDIIILDEINETKIRKHPDHFKLKEILNQSIIRNDFEKFNKDYNDFYKDLTNLDQYSLLYNSLNLKNTMISMSIFTKNNLKEEQLLNCIETVGIINDKKIIKKYISMGFDKKKYKGNSDLKSLFKSKKIDMDLISLFDKFDTQ